MRSVLKILTLFVGVLFLAIGIGFLLAPGTLATQFDLFPGGSAGYSTLRGDLAGLFLGMGAFTLLGRRWLAVPVTILAAIVAGRVVSLALDGPGRTQSLVLELVFLAILGAAWYADPKARWSSRAGIAVVALLALAAGGAVAFQRQIGTAILKRMVEDAFEHPLIDSLPDELHAGLCGAGAPLPDPNRAGPCVFVIAGRHLYIVDAGEDSPRKLQLMGISPALIEGVFLTHFHSDHIGGLGEMMLQHWAAGSHEQPLDVYGPPGVETVVDGFNAAYKLDAGYRTAHHGAATLPPSGAGGTARPFAMPTDRQVVLERAGLTISTFPVDHRPVYPAVGYRFDYRGRSVAISGDTAPTDSLVKAAQGVDVLFHEGLQKALVSMLHDEAVQHRRATIAKVAADILSYHTSPEDAARIAERAGARQLVIYHIIPELPFSYLNGAFLGDARKYFHGPITVARDGMMFSLPPASTTISVRELMQ